MNPHALSDGPASSPVAVVGLVSLLLAFVLAAWCVGAGIAGNARRSRRLVLSSVYGLYGFTALVSLASALMVYAFVTHDFSIKYVALTSDTSMSLTYKITAFWGALEGSLLFWVLILALFSAVAVRVNQHRHRDMIGYAVAAIMVVQLFFVALLIFTKNPFATSLTTPPADGQGLNPLLQNYWMVIHPPMLYVGYVAATIPFAFAVAALASGRLDDLWLSSVRTWVLVCFLFLSVGLVLGGRWAYEELGWGGYWAWDPVENAGLFPWFTATAFLHSSIIQEQRGMLKVWNMVLVIVTFLLTIFGTFMTRSGIVQSVHAFGKDDQLALLFILFMALVAVVSLGLLVFRAPKLRAANALESFTSREFAFLLNNWILLGCAFFVLFATMLATITEAFSGQRISVGIPAFNKIMTPAGLVLLLLAGVAPLLAWRRTTRQRLLALLAWPTGAMVVTVAALAVVVPDTRVGTPVFHNKLVLPMQLVCFGFVAFTLASIVQEYVQGVRVRMKQTGSSAFSSLLGMMLAKRRKYGGYIVHLGIVVMFVGFAGKAWDRKEFRESPASVEALLAPRVAAWEAQGRQGPRPEPTAEELAAATFQVGRYAFVYERFVEQNDDAKKSSTAVVGVYDGRERLATLSPATWAFHKGDQTTSEVAIHPRVFEDVYLVLDSFDARAGSSRFIVFVNPLINWVWLGCVILMLGTLWCLIPQSLVDLVGRGGRGRTPMGRAGEVAVVLLVAGAAAFGGVRAAYGQAPPGMEHVEQGAGPASHQAGGASASEFRPETAGTPEARALARRLMKQLVCLCGGCQRETLYDCKCGYAAQEREIVLQLLEGKDLGSSQHRTQAYDDVVAVFVRRYGGEHVLNEPRNQLSWVLPYAAVVGGLLLLFVLGRRWVGRGRAAAAAAPRAPAAAPAGVATDQAYADKLDDELRDVD